MRIFHSQDSPDCWTCVREAWEDEFPEPGPESSPLAPAAGAQAGLWPCSWPPTTDIGIKLALWPASYTLNTSNCTATAHCIPANAHCTPQPSDCTVYTEHCTLCTRHTTHCTLHTHTAQHTLLWGPSADEPWWQCSLINFTLAHAL